MTTVERDGEMVSVEGEWRQPDHRILPEILDEAARVIAQQLLPAGEKGVEVVLTNLMGCGLRMPAVDGLEEETVISFLGNQAANYQRLLKEVPFDILDKAADACVRESPHFPAIADLFRHAQPEIDKRRRQCLRINRLVDEAKRPRTAPIEREPIEWRLRGIIWSGWKYGRLDMARRAEIDLAKIENREPADWARPPATVLQSPPPASKRHGPLSRYATDVAHEVVEPWQAGESVYQPNHEPPPIAKIDEAHDVEFDP